MQHRPTSVLFSFFSSHLLSNFVANNTILYQVVHHVTFRIDRVDEVSVHVRDTVTDPLVFCTNSFKTYRVRSKNGSSVLRFVTLQGLFRSVSYLAQINNISFLRLPQTYQLLKNCATLQMTSCLTRSKQAQACNTAPCLRISDIFT